MEDSSEKKEQFNEGEDKNLTIKEKVESKKESKSNSSTKIIIIVLSVLIGAGLIIFGLISFMGKEEVKPEVKQEGKPEEEKPKIRVSKEEAPCLIGRLSDALFYGKVVYVDKTNDLEKMKVLAEERRLSTYNFNSLEETISKFLEPLNGTENYPQFAAIGLLLGNNPYDENTLIYEDTISPYHWGNVTAEELSTNLKMDGVIFYRTVLDDALEKLRKIMKN